MRATGLAGLTSAKTKKGGTVAKSSGGNAFVEFQHVQKSYDGETLVVKDLNLSMPKGEFLTMLGPSGSGKTTCLMMLAGGAQHRDKFTALNVQIEVFDD